LRLRGERIERGFAHVLDCGGLRRTTLRGLEKINKRYLCAIIMYNLSVLMRRRFGWGTPKQMAAAAKALQTLVLRLWRLCTLMVAQWGAQPSPTSSRCPRRSTSFVSDDELRATSHTDRRSERASISSCEP